MTTIDLTDPQNDTLADANLIAANNALIENAINGGLDNANIAAAAGILRSKIAGIAVGSVTAPFGGGSAFTSGMTVAHGLTGTPTAVLVTGHSTTAGEGIVGHSFQAPDSTNIYIRGLNPLGVPGVHSITLYWLAIV